MNGVLLDTCAAIWLAEGAPLSRDAVAVLQGGDQVHISPISAWEMGMLVSGNRYFLSIGTVAWFENLLGMAALTELSVPVLVNSSFLPGDPPPDPFDRMIIATARENALRIMTRDPRILGYAAQGHAQAIRC